MNKCLLESIALKSAEFRREKKLYFVSGNLGSYTCKRGGELSTTSEVGADNENSRDSRDRRI